MLASFPGPRAKPGNEARIVQACHVDPMSWHMGIKRTVARVKERFAWKGVVQDVQQIVS